MQLVLASDIEEMEPQNSYTAPKIKKERVDEHEINQLAKEMAEKNRQKMINQAAQIRQQNQVSQQALQRAGGQQMITFYFNREKDNANGSSDSLLPKKVEEKKKGVIDEESTKGKFGWTTIHSVHIPYVFRNEEKFCAVRMVEHKLLNKYLNCLPHEITTCIHVRSYYITEVEGKLLNEINGKHCEFQFGREPFTSKDLIVRLSDAKCFYKFLDTCHKKLVQKSPEQCEFCGFVRINGESVVPYTVKSNIKYVPLFYFEGETETLKLKAEKIEGWELAFLKFCCKVQGIRNELFASDTCAVVSLEDVKQYFPKETQFEDWWPQKTAEPMRIFGQGTISHANWTQRPPMPPTNSSQNSTPTTISAAVNKSLLTNNTTSLPHKTNTTLPSSIAGLSSLTNNLNNMNNLTNIYSQWSAAALMNGQAAQIQAQAQAQALAAAYANYPGMQSYLPDIRSVQRSSSILPNISSNSQRPPPLVRSSNAAAVTSQTYSASRMANSNLDALRHLGYLPDQTSSNPMEVLMNSNRHQSTGSNAAHSISITSTNQKSQPTKVPPPLIPVSNGMRTDNLSSHKGVGRMSIDKHKLMDVPPFRQDSSRAVMPYKVRKMVIDNKTINCINHSAYHYGDPNMVSVQDILREFFPTASLSECTEVFMNVLSVKVYRANWHQASSLMEAWGTDITPEVVPLVRSSDVTKYLSQIKYIFQRQQGLAQPHSKRIRT